MEFRSARGAYRSARSSMDGVIDGLISRFRRNPTANETPADLTAQFESAMQALKTYCERGQNLAPEAASGQRSLLRGLKFVLDVIDAASFVVTGIELTRENTISEADRAAIIKTLESRRWPDFDAVPPAP